MICEDAVTLHNTPIDWTVDRTMSTQYLYFLVWKISDLKIIPKLYNPRLLFFYTASQISFYIVKFGSLMYRAHQGQRYRTVMKVLLRGSDLQLSSFMSLLGSFFSLAWLLEIDASLSLYALIHQSSKLLRCWNFPNSWNMFIS